MTQPRITRGSGLTIGRQTLARIGRVVHWAEGQMRLAAPGPRSRARRRVKTVSDGKTWHGFKNESGETIDGYAVVRITDVTQDADGVRTYTVAKPDSSKDLRVHAACSHRGAPNGGRGALTFDFPVDMLYDGVTAPVAGETWGIETDNWKLKKDAQGFIAHGGAKLGRARFVAQSGLGVVFPITLSQTGGIQGTASAAATWTYTVTHALTGEALGTGVNPTAGNHKYNRPTAGQLSKADFGYAHYNAGALVIGYINERPGPGACT